jgi:hypothetical protein
MRHAHTAVAMINVLKEARFNTRFLLFKQVITSGEKQAVPPEYVGGNEASSRPLRLYYRFQAISY